MASLLQDEWRGLAHFRTESRRRVFQKKPDERTPSELYVLEEVFSDIKIISNLPFSKRLEICKFIYYEDVPECTPVYREGDEANTFYVIFTGSVKVTATYGRKMKLLNCLYAGDYFGEAAFQHEHYRRRENITTLRRCELLVLKKADYEAVLKTDITEEVLENFKSLQNIPVLSKIANGGMYRLASLLTHRSLPKNRVITFQGDDAREMFFIKSGECRVVMHVTAPADAPERSLPRAASSLCQYRPTTHDHCKQQVKDIQKHWGHPHFLTRPLTCPTSRSQSVPPFSPSTPSTHQFDPATAASPVPVPVAEPTQGRPFSAPEARGVKFKGNSAESKQLSVPREFDEAEAANRHESDSLKRSSSAHGHHHHHHTRQSRLKSEKQQMHPRQKQALPFLPSSMKQSYLEQEQENAQQTSGRLKSIRLSRKSRPLSQMSLRSYKSRKGSKDSNNEYSLESLLKEINHKFSDESIQDLEFSDKEAMLWGMGTADTGLMRGDVSDPVVYQKQFEVWVRTVISREKKLKALEESSEDGLSSSFRSSEDAGEESETEKLFKAGIVLDVGGLHAGEYFGEAGLVSKCTRAASILTVTDVELLVLTNADFSRRLDQDIIACLCAANYKKAGYMLEQFHKTHRWELVKKRVMRDALLGKKEKFPNRFYHDMNDAIRRKGEKLV